MEDLNKELEQITEEINAIDKRLDKILQEQINENEETPFGLFSIVDNNVKLELFIDENLFEEDELNKLEQIANIMQEVLISIHQREGNK